MALSVRNIESSKNIFDEITNPHPLAKINCASNFSSCKRKIMSITSTILWWRTWGVIRGGFIHYWGGVRGRSKNWVGGRNQKTRVHSIFLGRSHRAQPSQSTSKASQLQPHFKSSSHTYPSVPGLARLG